MFTYQWPTQTVACRGLVAVLLLLYCPGVCSAGTVRSTCQTRLGFMVCFNGGLAPLEQRRGACMAVAMHPFASQYGALLPARYHSRWLIAILAYLCLPFYFVNEMAVAQQISIIASASTYCRQELGP